MKLRIAETGKPPVELRGDWPNYPGMFDDMLRGAGGRFEIETIDVEEGEVLPGPEDGAALLVTGSASGVYEDLAFIAPLEDAVRRYADAGRPVVGICFGHQLVASAFGARVEKSDKGWGVGVHTYEIVGETPWEAGPRRFACAVSHQDQVLTPPPGFRRVAGSAFCPNGVLAHDTKPVLTFQMHPEFPHDFASALMALRSDRIPADRAELGQATLNNPTDRGIMALWIRKFLEAGF